MTYVARPVGSRKQWWGLTWDRNSSAYSHGAALAQGLAELDKVIRPAPAHPPDPGPDVLPARCDLGVYLNIETFLEYGDAQILEFSTSFHVSWTATPAPVPILRVDRVGHSPPQLRPQPIHDLSAFLDVDGPPGSARTDVLYLVHGRPLLR